MTLSELVHAALKEDMPHGDLTTESLAQGPRIGIARLYAKEDLVLSGASCFELTMATLDSETKMKWHFEDGDLILNKQAVCTLHGDLVQILRAERVALNFIGHLSGIATLTRCYVQKIAHTKTKILDTRKTTPGYRDLEKRAVVHGGGVNHRANLSDGILIKDNHISLMGGLAKAVLKVRENCNEPIVVETRTLSDVQEASSLNVERILLDNMSNEMMRDALKIIPSHIKTEASGNMNMDRIASVAELGVDYISVGALTHSAPVADMSLMFDWNS